MLDVGIHQNISLRCSALPMAKRCPGSVRPSSVRLNETNPFAELGNAVHEGLRPLVETGSLNWDELPGIAARWGVDAAELRMLCAVGSKLWPQIAGAFEGALAEVALSAQLPGGVTLTGHADGLAIHGDVARGLDWKSGRKDADHSAQMRGYAGLILLENPGLVEATVTIVWLRDQEIENYTMDRQGLRVWLAEVTSEIIEWDGVYHPGAHCGHCPRSHECEASNAVIRRDVAAIADKSLVVRAECEIAKMAPDEIVDVLRKADMVTKYAARVREAITNHVKKNGDVVADGVRLTIETQERRTLDPLAAWHVLEAAGFTDKDFARVIDLRRGRVNDVAAEKAGKGKGAAAVRALEKSLEDADAIEVTKTERLREKRA